MKPASDQLRGLAPLGGTVEIKMPLPEGLGYMCKQLGYILFEEDFKRAIP